jgi:hypothetical protein
LVIACGSLPLLLLAVLLANDPPITPPVLIRSIIVLSLLPYLATVALQHLFAAEVALDGEFLVVCLRGRRFEIPRASIAAVTPWVIPITATGLWIKLRSGRRFQYGLQRADPRPLISLLATAGLPIDSTHASFVYAETKHAGAPWRWHHYAAKFVLFALAPTAVLFNAHQHIAYGGTLGQYYLLGLRAYLTTFAVYWATLSIYLVLYAAVWRGLAEAFALLTAWIAPERALRVRHGLERMCAVAFYAGVPVLVLIRFLP